MANFRMTSGVAACLAALAAGCTASPPKLEDVKEAGAGLYTIGYSAGSGIGNARNQEQAMAAAVGQAGEYCHAKELKLLVTTTGRNSVTFRCVVD